MCSFKSRYEKKSVYFLDHQLLYKIGNSGLYCICVIIREGAINKPCIINVSLLIWPSLLMWSKIKVEIQTSMLWAYLRNFPLRLSTSYFDVLIIYLHKPKRKKPCACLPWNTLERSLLFSVSFISSHIQTVHFVL